jgi:hypothetical protein
VSGINGYCDSLLIVACEKTGLYLLGNNNSVNIIPMRHNYNTFSCCDLEILNMTFLFATAVCAININNYQKTIILEFIVL